MTVLRTCHTPVVIARQRVGENALRQPNARPAADYPLTPRSSMVPRGFAIGVVILYIDIKGLAAA
jgi:hypothetical protein